MKYTRYSFQLQEYKGDRSIQKEDAKPSLGHVYALGGWTCLRDNCTWTATVEKLSENGDWMMLETQLARPSDAFAAAALSGEDC